MLDAVIRLSLRYRPLVVVLALAVMAYGGYLSTAMPIDVFPDLDRPRVVVLAECPGLSPEEVEALVTHPVETSLLGAAGVQAVRSQSSMGLVVIYAEFGWGTDTRAARQVVQERLATLAGALPDGVRPQMMPPTSIMGQFMHAGLYRRAGPQGGDLFPLGRTGLLVERTGSELAVWRPRDRNDPATWERVTADRVVWDAPPPAGEDRERRVRVTVGGRPQEVVLRTPLQQQMDLRATADWVVRPRLLQIPGVAEVLVMGGDRKQYQVLVDPDALLEHDVTLGQVERAVRDNNLNASGGFTAEGQAERPVRVIGRLGPLPEKVVDDLRKVPVKTTPHRTVLLGQVARVEEGPEPKRGDGSIDGHPGVVITVVKQPHADTRGLTDAVKAALRSVEEGLPADLAVNTDLFQLKTFIDRGVYHVGEALVLGAGLVVVILFLFLLNVRTTFVTLTAIPLSLVVTTLVFRLIGALTGTELSINVMTLGGIAVAMGELVDDAIVDVENIHRRLRENNASPAPRPALRVVYEASREVRTAVVFGTAVVVLAFLPLFALSGVEGRLFAPLGVAYVVSILASLLVSLTVTPVLSYYLLPRSRAAHRANDGLLLRVLKWGAGHLVRFSMRRAGALLLLTWALVGLSAWQLTRLGTDFLPQFDEGSVQINVNLPPGSSLQASNEAAAVIDARLRRMQKTADNPGGEVLHFVRRTGRAELDEHAAPVTAGEYILSMNPDSGRTREETLRHLLAGLKEDLPGVDIEAEQPLAHLISHMLSGVQAQIAVKVYGDDVDVLRRVAREVEAVVGGVPGVTDPVIEPQVQVDELHVVLRPDDLAFHGVSRAHVAEFVQTALRGEAVSAVLDGRRRFDLVVKLREPHRSDYTRLRELRLDLPDGRGQVRLGDVADFPDGSVGPNQLMRENVRRRAVVRCNVSGRDLGGAVADIERRVKGQVVLPEGYTVEYGGQFQSQRSATLLIGVLAGVSVAGMFVVLLMLQPSVRVVLQILNAVPAAFVGGVAALVLTGQTLTVASLVGFVSLGGIAVRNGILLVTHYLHLMREEGEGFTPGMVVRGSLERLAPVLMTALTAGIALLPIVLGGQKPGLEILYPVATVILGGLVTSTFCEFLLHPGLFWRFSGRDAERLAREGQGGEAALLSGRPA
ncbi:MAG: CusA/CzcA family heavy metal efflux RND transporter [Isosphaera sp.]|nr:CusA/CzcA family heavy metal efflux RND transporter [Isosphaera sp.]